MCQLWPLSCAEAKHCSKTLQAGRKEMRSELRDRWGWSQEQSKEEMREISGPCVTGVNAEGGEEKEG